MPFVYYVKPSRPKDTHPLQTHVDYYVKRGYHVQLLTKTSAMLVKPKQFSLTWALLWFVFGIGVGFILYLLYYGAKKNKAVYLSVSNGKVSART